MITPGAARTVWADSGLTEVIDDTDARFAYSKGDANNGGWTAGSSESDDPVTSEHWANKPGATAKVSFEGTGFELYGIKAPNHRYISVSIDDGEPAEVDCYASSRQSNQKLFEVSNLKQGSHTALVTVLDKVNPEAKNALGVSLQYAIAKGISLDPNRDITSRIEVGSQTDGDELYRWNFAPEDKWTYGDTHPELFSAGDEIYSDKGADVTATLRFEGTRIIVGGSLNSGHSVYRFTLDGEDRGTFNAADTTETKHQQTLFDSGELENGEHELVISNAGSGAVQLDYADVVHKPIKPTSITLDADELALEAGQTRELKATLAPEIADPAEVVWETSDADVVTVEDGVVTAQDVSGKSEATVTATVADTDVSASVAVKVFPKVKDFNAFVGDEKILDLPADAYADAKTDFTDEWSDTAWRGDSRASKIGVATRDAEVKDALVEVSDFTTDEGAVISADNVEVNWLREVEADANRGMSGIMKSYPDVIYYANDGRDIPAETLQFAWVTISVPTDAKPGVYHATLTVKAGDVSYPLDYTLEVLNLVQPTAREVGYSVQLWQHPFSATGYYFGKSTVDGTSSGGGLWGAPIGTDAPIDKFMDEDFQAYYKGILTDYAEMGGNDLVANIVDDAWGHQCYYSDSGMITWTKTADGWEFDYTLFDEWVEFAIECGVIDPAENYGAIKCYSMIPWNDRISYVDEETGEETYMEPVKLSDEWKSIWATFLDDFMAHLDEKGWFDITYIAFDERPQIDGVCKFIKEHKNADGKALKTAAAINYSPENIGEHMYIDDVSVGQKHVLSAWDMDEWYAFVDERREEGLKTTMYTCTGDYPNSSQQADPGDIYWSALYSQSLHTDGYLRWALDAWINDMYGDTSYINWEPGDPWFIYPLELGEDGTYDPSKLAENPKGYYSSPRYEMFKQGVRDVCKARYLENLDSDTAAAVTELFDGMQFPEGTNNIPNDQEERMLTHSETARVYDGLTEIARAAAPAPEPEPEPEPEPDVDKGDLSAAIDAVKPDSESGKYTADSWAAYQDAVERAKGVLADENATQKQVDDTLAALEAAERALVKVDEQGAGGQTGGEVDGKPTDEAGEQSGDDLPQTGDSTLLAVGACVLAAGVAITGGRVLSRRRNH